MTKAEKCKKWREDNPDHKEVKNEARKKKYREDVVYRKDLLRKAALGAYRMTPAEYDSKLAEQGGHCALCENVAKEKSLHVDHDHNCCPKKRGTCGKCNRGILCQSCNTRLGYLEATLSGAEVIARPGTWTDKALAYLEGHKWRHAEESDEVQDLLGVVCDYFENQKAPTMFGSVLPEGPPRTATGSWSRNISRSPYPGRLCVPLKDQK